VIAEGAAKAHTVAGPVYARAHEAMGLLPLPE
jgi:hypothetical protein